MHSGLNKSWGILRICCFATLLCVRYIVYVYVHFCLCTSCTGSCKWYTVARYVIVVSETYIVNLDIFYSRLFLSCFVVCLHSTTSASHLTFCVFLSVGNHDGRVMIQLALNRPRSRTRVSTTLQSCFVLEEFDSGKFMYDLFQLPGINS